MPAALDRFLPHPDVRERHELDIDAPASLAFDVARAFDLQSVPAVHAIFRLREWLMGAAPTPGATTARLDVAGLRAIGWGTLEEQPGRLLVAGAACRPWEADVTFLPLDAASFLSYAEPDAVRIAWTIEAEWRSAATSRLATETRAQGTDAAAREKFRKYWRWARVGIVGIRRLVLPAMKREAERRFRAGGGR